MFLVLLVERRFFGASTILHPGLFGNKQTYSLQIMCVSSSPSSQAWWEDRNALGPSYTTLGSSLLETLKKILFIFGCAGPSLWRVGSFSCTWAFLSCRVPASHCCWFLLLWSTGYRVLRLSSCGIRSLVAPYEVQLPRNMWDLSSQTRDQTCVLCIGRQILNHWTIKEVLILIFEGYFSFKKSLLCRIRLFGTYFFTQSHPQCYISLWFILLYITLCCLTFFKKSVLLTYIQVVSGF